MLINFQCIPLESILDNLRTDDNYSFEFNVLLQGSQILLKVRLWVIAHSASGLCVFLNIFAIFTCKLTYYILN